MTGPLQITSYLWRLYKKIEGGLNKKRALDVITRDRMNN